MRRILIGLMVICCVWICQASVVTGQENDSVSTLSEARNQYRQRVKGALASREAEISEKLGNLPGSRALVQECTSAKNSYRDAQADLTAIETTLASGEADEIYKSELTQLRQTSQTAITSAKQQARTVGEQMSARKELESQLASVQKERQELEAKWQREDRPTYAVALGEPSAFSKGVVAGREHGNLVHVPGLGSTVKPIKKLPWEFSLCFPKEAEKKSDAETGTVIHPTGGSKPVINVVYFVPKWTKPDLTVITNRMEQAQRWFQNKHIGTFEFLISVDYAKKEQSFYQTNVWDKVNNELGLTCDENENGISIVIVDHSPILRKNSVGIGRHCGDDFSSGLTGHAMVSFQQLKSKNGLDTLIHEMGHALSLPHNNLSTSIMYPYTTGKHPATAVLVRKERAALKNSPYFSE